MNEPGSEPLEIGPGLVPMSKVNAIKELRDLRHRIDKEYFGPPSRERACAITRLDEAIHWMEAACGY